MKGQKKIAEMPIVNMTRYVPFSHFLSQGLRQKLPQYISNFKITAHQTRSQECITPVTPRVNTELRKISFHYFRNYFALYQPIGQF